MGLASVAPRLQSSGANIYSTTTGPDGRYTLANLPAGSYLITPSQPGQTFGPRSRQVTVPSDAANQDFVRHSGTTTIVVPGTALPLDTGIAVRQGQTLAISASGLVFTIAGQVGSSSGPEGQPTLCPTLDSPTDCVSNGAPYGALVGKIGVNGSPFLVGASAQLVAPATGVLYLAANDNLIYYGDNAGDYTVTVSVQSASHR
jgi:hypothetical protein